MRRWISSSSASKLFAKNSIPSRRPEDVVALFANSAPTISSRAESGPLFDHLRDRILGFHASHALQILSILDRFNATLLPPQVVLDDLKDVIVSGKLGTGELVKGLEILAKFQGSLWDPQDVHPLVIADHSFSVAQAVRLAMIGIPVDVPMVDDSSLVSAKLALLHNKPELVANVDTVPLAAIPYVAMTHAAWLKSSALPSRWHDRAQTAVPAMEPGNAQMTLWSLLAMGYDASHPLLVSLYTVASRGVWKSLAMKNQCMLKMEDDFDVPYPVRIPQIAAKRKLAMIDAIALTCPTADKNIRLHNHFIDLRIGNKLILVNPVPKDPFFQIYKRHFPADVAEVSSLDNYS